MLKKDCVFSFVILNYLTTEDTIACVESIQKKCKDYNYKIIIVDNDSSNGSGKELLQRYCGENNIKVFLNKKNMGFARGNNVGFAYAKEELNSDFIILCNSDTEVLEENFCSEIEKKFKETKFAVLGPKEKLVDGTYYPLNRGVRSKEKLKLDLCYFESELKKQNISAKFYQFLIIVYNLINGIRAIGNRLDCNNEYYDIVLHGAFLIFSKEYIDLFDGLNPITYFYGEEEFLALRLKKYGLHSVYYPEIEILHKRNSATNASTKSKKQKKKFTLSCHLDATKKLLAAVKGEIEL